MNFLVVILKISIYLYLAKFMINLNLNFLFKIHYLSINQYFLKFQFYRYCFLINLSLIMQNCD